MHKTPVTPGLTPTLAAGDVLSLASLHQLLSLLETGTPDLPVSAEWLQRVRDACGLRLKERGVIERDPLREKAALALEGCAQLAASIEQLAIDAIIKDKGAVGHELRCISQLIGQLGYQADLGASLIGSGPCFGDAEHWMMPPSFKHIGAAEVQR